MLLFTAVAPARADAIPRAIVGRWVAQSGNMLMDIRPDGTITIGPNSGRCLVRGDSLTIIDPKARQSLTFRFTITNNTLLLSNPSIGFKVLFVRQGPGIAADSSNVPASRSRSSRGGGWFGPGQGSGQPPNDDADHGDGDEDRGPRNRNGAPSADRWGLGRSNAPTSPGTSRAQSPSSGMGLTRSQAMMILGRTKSYRLFTLSTKIPKNWDSVAIKRSDPDGILIFAHPVPGLGRGRHGFTLPVIVGPYLPASSSNPNLLAGALVQWMVAVAAPKVAQRQGMGGGRMQWGQPKMQQAQGPSGRRIISVSLSGTQGQLSMVMVGTMVVSRSGHAALFATGLGTGRSMARLSPQGRRLVLAAFKDLLQKLVALAAVSDVRPGRRNRSMERRLWRRGVFLYSSRSAYFNSGMSSGGSYETSNSFRVRFLPGRHCVVESSAAARAGYVNSDTGDSGAAAAGHDGGGGGPARCEVRRGVKGLDWLVVYNPPGRGGTGFHRIERRGSEKCGDRLFHGLAIDGYVEGEYVDVNGNCTRKVR